MDKIIKIHDSYYKFNKKTNIWDKLIIPIKKKICNVKDVSFLQTKDVIVFNNNKIIHNNKIVDLKKNNYITYKLPYNFYKINKDIKNKYQKYLDMLLKSFDKNTIENFFDVVNRVLVFDTNIFAIFNKSAHTLFGYIFNMFKGYIYYTNNYTSIPNNCRIICSAINDKKDIKNKTLIYKKLISYSSLNKKNPIIFIIANNLDIQISKYKYILPIKDTVIISNDMKKNDFNLTFNQNDLFSVIISILIHYNASSSS